MRPNAEPELGSGREAREGGRPRAAVDLEERQRDGPPAVGQNRGEQVHPGRAHERGDEAVPGRPVEVPRRPDLHDPPLAEHADPLGHRQRLELIGRRVEHRHAELPVEPLELHPRVVAEFGVEVRQGLVEEEQLRPPDDRAPDRDPLLLAAAQRLRPAPEGVADPQELGDLADPPLDLRRVQARLPQGIGEIVVDRQVRVEREGLEDHPDPAALDGSVGQVSTPRPDGSRVEPLEPGHRAEQRRLAGPARSEDAEELASRSPPPSASTSPKRLTAPETSRSDIRPARGRRGATPRSPCRRFSGRARERSPSSCRRFHAESARLSTGGAPSTPADGGSARIAPSAPGPGTGGRAPRSPGVARPSQAEPRRHRRACACRTHRTIRSGVMGSSETSIPSGARASWTAFATAAGATMRPPSPLPLSP